MVTIRPATHADIPDILEFWRRAAENTDRQDDASKVTALIDHDPDALLVAELDGVLAGTVIAGWDGWRAHLYRLAVAPEFRRRGVGSALIAAAEKRFENFGAFRADAMVLRDNDLAHHAWKAAGYHAQPHWGRWVKTLG
ncbi:GNAT family N-acetyltransferase [Acrocarpospora catenulata]|uniref:GNAT family N-acetyltransferase n=1 Tax=Acrocarpospora catenulata TaxID=2836182 RepID=UPI001BD93629|nr:GNAT family N-acetyltransferase [Acrocarpospora catenulata]